MNNAVLLLCCIMVSGCASSGYSKSWESAGGGKCENVAVFFAPKETPQCPHQKQGEPISYVKTDKAIGYFCYCVFE